VLKRRRTSRRRQEPPIILDFRSIAPTSKRGVPSHDGQGAADPLAGAGADGPKLSDRSMPQLRPSARMPASLDSPRGRAKRCARHPRDFQFSRAMMPPVHPTEPETEWTPAYND
jgi:hypothetical protein